MGRRLGVRLQSVEVRTGRSLDEASGGLTRERAAALLVLRVARALGLVIPPTGLARADQVIE